MSHKGSPLHRLEQALGSKTGKDGVQVFAGDAIDCGGNTDELKTVKPGKLISLPASQVRKLCAGIKASQAKVQEKEQRVTAQAQREHEDAKEMVRLQEEEIQTLKAENATLKKDPAK